MIDLILTDGVTKNFETAMQNEIEKFIKHFERELTTIRSGRAHPSFVEDIKVSCYGGTSIMRLRDMASVAAPDVRLITIQPWDLSLLADIEKALANSELGVTPQNDGAMIRIVLPEMSTERREELVKILKKKLEDSKVNIRNVRKEFHNLIRDSLKNKTISEDHSRRLSDLMEKITAAQIERCDKLADKKSKELTTI